MRLLVSGFAAFGGRDINPTAHLVDSLNRKEIVCPDGMDLRTVILPVTFEHAYSVLKESIDEFNPDVIIALGQAAGRSAIELESVAVNKIKADIADNAGKTPQDEPINHLGPDAYISTLPIQGIEGALKNAGLPVKISNSAGTFVCNYLFYRLMEENQETLRLCGFIHVPLLPEQAKENESSLSLDELKAAMSVILNYVNY